MKIRLLYKHAPSSDPHSSARVVICPVMHRVDAICESAERQRNFMRSELNDYIHDR